MKKSNSIKQHKGLSQVFLQTPVPCQKIVEFLQANGVDQCIEIGPGDGILSAELVASSIRTLAIEKDPRFVARLEEKFGNQSENFKVLCGDFLEQDLNQLLAESEFFEPQEAVALIGNIPYHLSSPIVLKALASPFKYCCFLVQKEFGERLVATPHSKAYGSLSIFCQLQATVQNEMIVSKLDFYPVPKVDSMVVSLVKHADPEVTAEDLTQLSKIMKACFSKRRKKLRNAISPVLGEKSLDDLEEIVDLDLRPENIPPLTWIHILKTIR